MFPAFIVDRRPFGDPPLFISREYNIIFISFLLLWVWEIKWHWFDIISQIVDMNLVSWASYHTIYWPYAAVSDPSPLRCCLWYEFTYWNVRVCVDIIIYYASKWMSRKCVFHQKPSNRPDHIRKRQTFIPASIKHVMKIKWTIPIRSIIPHLCVRACRQWPSPKEL